MSQFSVSVAKSNLAVLLGRALAPEATNKNRTQPHASVPAPFIPFAPPACPERSPRPSASRHNAILILI